jgi:hypothetical protein
VLRWSLPCLSPSAPSCFKSLGQWQHRAFVPKTVAGKGACKHIQPLGTGIEGRGRLSTANRVPGHLGLSHQHLLIRLLLGAEESLS